MLARENKKVVCEDTLSAKVTITRRVYIYMSSERFFVLHLLHLHGLNV